MHSTCFARSASVKGVSPLLFLTLVQMCTDMHGILCVIPQCEILLPCNPRLKECWYARDTLHFRFLKDPGLIVYLFQFRTPHAAKFSGSGGGGKNSLPRMSAPKFPSCKNIGLTRAVTEKTGHHKYRDDGEKTEGDVADIFIIGHCLGVIPGSKTTC